MAEKLIFTIRKTFLVPMGVLLALCLTLFGASLLQGATSGKILVLVCLTLPVLVVFAESFKRRLTVDDAGLKSEKLLRAKYLPFSEVTAVEAMMVRKRAYLTICAGEDFLLLSNAYGNFPDLVRGIVGHLPPEVISDQARAMAEKPPVRSSDVISVWLAVGMLSFVLYLQLVKGL